MGLPTVEEEKIILFQGIGVLHDEELRNSWFIILSILKKDLGLGIFETFTESGIESDLLQVTSTFVGSSLYTIGGRVPNDYELSDSIRWLDTRSDSKEWTIGTLPSPCADPVIGVYDYYLYILPGEWKYGCYDMDEDAYLTSREGYIWNTRENKCLETSILPPKVEGERRQWSRIRACAALDGRGLLVAMDGEEKNFFLHNPDTKDWETCDFKDPLPKFIGKTSFAASNGRLYILEVRGKSPAFLYIYDIKEGEGKLVMDKMPVPKFDDDLWSMDERERVVRIVPVADNKLCFLWLGPVSYENEKMWPPVRILHYLKVKLSFNPNPCNSEVEVVRSFRTNITNLLDCLPCEPEQFGAEVERRPPLYLQLDVFQRQLEDKTSAEAIGTSLVSGEPFQDQAVDIASPEEKGRTLHEDPFSSHEQTRAKISQEEKQTPEPQNISKLTSQPQGRTFEISQEKKTPEPQNISKLTSQPEGRTFEISQEEKQTPEPQNISKLTSQPSGRTLEISQEEKQTAEPQNISKLTSRPLRTFEISQEARLTPEPQNISKLTSQPEGGIFEISQEKKTPEPQNISKQTSQGRKFKNAVGNVVGFIPNLNPITPICPVVQNASGNVLGNLFGGIFTLISNPITLVRKCNNNLDNLKNKVAGLKDEKETVENHAEALDRNGELIAQKLRNWLTRANNVIEAADDLVADAEGNAKKKCFFGLCLNPKSRYQLSKKAKGNSEAILDLVYEACGFNLPLSNIPAPPKEVAAPVKGFEDFYSRKDVLERIMEALQSRSSSIIGVHGMPGMGKTMLAKEIKRKAEQDKLFDAVVMALVSSNADLKNIQVEIARGLGLDQLPNGITTQDAAERIKERLKKMNKVLIILDDVWRPGIDLEELGIPLKDESKTNEGSSSREEFAECKILITSRDSDVLSDLMGSPQNFSLHQLEFEEGWELLKRIVGDRAESDDEIHSTAIEIVWECGGLPLAITTIATALKNKKPYEWRDALRKLRKPSSENFNGVSAKVYSAIEVSYSHLESEKLKKTFLLCCLIGHKYFIQDLLKHGVGLGLFANTMEEARDEVFTLIGKLRASSLLIDDYDDNRFDMHDLIHDVAVSIACRDRLGLLLTGDQLPKEWSDMEAMKDFKWIHMRYANVDGLPEELESPHLNYFCLTNKNPSLQIPTNFFKGMQKLKVLDLTRMHMSSLPSSISLLKNLHTLCLDDSVLGDIRIIGELKNLEILSLLRSDFEELPREIGQLTQLKLLDLHNCTKLKIIAPRVLASMSRLEELDLRNSFHGWEVEESESQINASLAELKHLKKLTTLEVCIPDIQMISKDFFFENLKRYKIFIGDKWEDQDSSFGSSRILKLHLNASINSNYLVKMLLKMTEELHLRELAGVRNVVDELNTEGFQDLKYLYVRNAPDVQHIIKSTEWVLFNAFPNLEVLYLQNLINLEKIFQGQCKETAFNKLRMITVESCDKLKNLFSSFIARQLLQLQEISVANCSNMEEIVDDEGQGSRNDIVEATDQLKFGEVLRSLRLKRLPKLVCVKRSCGGMQLFNEQVVFPNLEELHLSWINVNSIWHPFITTPYVEKLTKLIIKGCDNLEYLFSSPIARGMVTLGQLEIKQCEKMREVLFLENVKDNGNLIFPQLRVLLIEKLPKLRMFCSGNCIKIPCLSQLTINSCPVLKTFISGSTFGHMIATSEKAQDTCTPPLFDTKVELPNLQFLILSSLTIQQIWHNQHNTDTFCQLNYLNVNSCEKLLNIFPLSMMGRLQRLNKLQIWICGSLEEIFESEGLGVSQSPSQITTQSSMVEPPIKFVFPKLTHLDLYMLPKLKGFYCQMHTAEWPSLKILEVYGCDQVQIFGSEFSRFQRTNGDDRLGIKIKCPFFLISKATFPCLEELKLGRNNSMKEIWHGEYLGDYFPKLKILELTQFPEQSIVQPFFFQSLSNLEKLVVSEAPFHEIFQCQGLGGEENPTLALGQLSELRLSKLHELTYLWKEESHLESIFYNLKILEVQECSKLKNLVPSFISFKNLTNLKVVECHELLNLIGYSTAKSMVQLTRMSISECKMIKEIVACLDDEVQDGIVFRQLKYLELDGLPRLASFCSGNCNFEFTSLEEVIVMSCPIMEIFSQGKCKTPNKLRKVKFIKDEDEGFWEGNLNSTIQKMFMEKVGYSDLKLSKFPELIESSYKKPQEKLLFKRLKSLEVCNCNNLRYLLTPSMALGLLTPSMALGLVQLHDLKVSNCAMMEQVITGEGYEEMFPLLNSIVLESCSNLICFYEGRKRLKFESLKQITVADCPILVAFVTSFSREQGKEITTDDKGSEERHDIPTQPFFSDKVVCPNLEELQLSWISVNTIWHTSITSSYVEKLMKLIINGCDNLKYLFSYSMARHLVILGHLEINGCKKMREVLFTENVEENGNLIFPRLRFLLIQSLPKLRGFCYGYYIKFPCLSQLSIKCCPVLKTFIFGSTFGHMTTTSNKAKNICTPLFDTKVTFTKLEQLILEYMGSLDQIWDNQLDADSFCQLNQLSVWNCGKLLNIFPFSMLEKLQNLDNLKIWNCDSLEEIFESQGVGVSQSQAQNITRSVEPATKFVFSTLTCVELRTLPKLKAFCHQMYTIECPSLKELKVSGCDQVQTFASELLSFPRTKGDNNELEIQTKYPLFWISKATFPSLEELELHRNGIMKEIWHGKYSGDYFPKLTRMMIRECDMLKEIVACVDDKEKDGIIVFSQLKHLELCGLPRLASFCSTNCSFEFASLEEVIVMGCPNMQIFSQGECSTPNKLQKVKFTDEGAVDDDEDRDEDEAEGFWEGNLNSTIQKMFTEKAGYHGLENLKVSEFPELIEIWNKKPQEILPFKRLKSLEICNCNSLRYLPTTSMVLGFAQLEYLKVANCAAMEQVLTGEGAKEMFPWLTSIILESCPDLKCFYEGSSRLELPSLYEITIADCPVLAAFASSFPSEQEKETTTNDREGEERPFDIPTQPFFSDKATFPRLYKLKVEGNNVMKEVWRGHHPGDYFPYLRVVELINFPEQSAVLPPFFFQSLPRLQKLVVSNASFTEIFQCEGVDAEGKPANGLPWLREKPTNAPTLRGKPANALTWFSELRLSKLDELKYLWKEELHLELVFYNLRILEVQECSKLKNLVPSFISFENLTILEVSKCHGLIHVVGYSTAKSMVQLERMSISECDMIDEIVALGDEEMKDGICFSRLEYLELHGLPKLASFSSRNCGFNFPSLEEVIVMKCPNMQTFSTGQLSTPELQEVKLKEDGNECCWYGNLNSTIQHLFMEKV